MDTLSHNEEVDVLIARTDERVIAVADRVNALDLKLDGFPQYYSTKTEMDTLKILVDAIRTDHVTSADFDTIRDRIAAGESRVTYLYGSNAVLIGLIIALGVKLFAS